VDNGVICRYLLQIGVFLEGFFVFLRGLTKYVNCVTYIGCNGTDFENKHSVRMSSWFSGAFLLAKGY
jgi:hypothetical protein